MSPYCTLKLLGRKPGLPVYLHWSNSPITLESQRLVDWAFPFGGDKPREGAASGAVSKA